MRHGGFLKFFLFLIAISIIMDFYVHQGLRTLGNGWSSKSRAIMLWGYWLLSLTVVILLVAGLSSFNTARGMQPYHEWVLSIFLTLFISKLVFILVLFLGDTGRLFAGLFGWISKAPHHSGYIPARRKFVTEIGLLLAAVPLSSFIYAMVKGKYDYTVHRQTLYFEDLPDAFDGFTITQLSDIHSGSFDNRAAVQRGIQLAQDQQSDLFVFTGDLVNNAAWEIEPYLEDFSKLRAPYGQYSILGNHDYGDYIQWESAQEKADNLEKLKKHHQSLGYRLLLDEHIEIEKEGQKIVLIGVQNWGRGFKQVGDLDKAMTGVNPDNFKILLSHDPTHWEEKVRYHPSHIHLTLAGHTHGAQFGVETDTLRWSPVKYRYLDWAGPAQHNNRHLYVNRGFGFLAFSGRLGIWPEITVITLKRKPLNT